MTAGSAAGAEQAQGIVTRSYAPATGPFQVQSLGVMGTGGSFTLRTTGASGPVGETAPVAFGAPACHGEGSAPTDPCDPGSMQALLAAAGGEAVVTGGPEAAPDSPYGFRYTIAFADPDAGALEVASNLVTTTGWIPNRLEIQCVFCIDDYGAPSQPNGVTVVLVHGGGMLAGSKEDWGGVAPAFVAAGYRTFSVNYRLVGPEGAPDAGCSFDSTMPRSARCLNWLAGVDAGTDDLRGVMTWLRANATSLGIDPAHIVALGFSAGAILALHALYGPGPADGVPSAAVSVSGIMDPSLVTGAAGPALLFTHAGADTAFAGGFLSGVDAQTEHERLVSRARAFGNVVHLRSQPGLGHGLGESPTAFAEAMLVADAFLRTHLLGAVDRGSGLWFGNTGGFDRAITQERPAGPGDHLRPVVADFDGNGIDDVLWYAWGAAPDSIWFGQADGTFHDPLEWSVDASDHRPAVDVGGTYEPIVGDSDGDGCADILWWSPTDGLRVMVWYSNCDGAFTELVLGDAPPGISAFPGDFAGLGREDGLLYWPERRAAALFRPGTTRGSYRMVYVGTELPIGATPLIDDFDGDGRDDVLWSAGAESVIWYGAADDDPAGMVAVATSMAAGAVTLLGDIDGDARSDIVRAGANEPAALAYGAAARGTFDEGALLPAPASPASPEAVVAGDFDGDGLTDVLWPSDPGSAQLLRGTADRAAGLVATPSAVALPVGHRAAVGSFDAAPLSAGRATADVLWYRAS